MHMLYVYTISYLSHHNQAETNKANYKLDSEFGAVSANRQNQRKFPKQTSPESSLLASLPGAN